MDHSKIKDTFDTYQDLYPACHPSVLSCKQQTIALDIVHDVSKIYNHKDMHTAVLLLVATAHPRP